MRGREKLVHVPQRILPCAYLQTPCTFAPRILERDDYLHRDTSSLSRLVYLLIYFPVLRCVPVSSSAVSRCPYPFSLCHLNPRKDFNFRSDDGALDDPLKGQCSKMATFGRSFRKGTFSYAISLWKIPRNHDW